MLVARRYQQNEVCYHWKAYLLITKKRKEKTWLNLVFMWWMASSAKAGENADKKSLSFSKVKSFGFSLVVSHPN